MNQIKRVLSGIIAVIAVVILTLRLSVNFTLTGLYQGYMFILGQSGRVYWTIENEWLQYRMDLEEWWKLWRYGPHV